ncbi:MAG: dTMP kinase [Patescibacteria group bacterium]|nr:dTMP kinase [Patescibacteria group bacterium]
MGLLITIEGGEYVGKTTLAIPGLLSLLESCGIPVLSSREPGGTPEGERIRNEIFRKVADGANEKELAILFNKARRIHLDTVIIPFLGKHKEKNAVVLLDRYLDSTRVYQGLEGKLGLETIYELEREFVDGYLPDLTFILYFPDTMIEKLITARRMITSPVSGDRSHTAWDDVPPATHRKRQEWYLSLAELAKKNGETRVFELVDASLPPGTVIGQIARKTLQYIMSHSCLNIPRNFTSCFEDALNAFRASPLHIKLDRQWKRQQHLLTQL